MATIKEAASFLLSRDNFLILTHRRPDGDTLGSAAGLCETLRTLGKTAYILVNPEITEKYVEYVSMYYPPENYAHNCVVAVDIAAPGMLPVSAAAFADKVDLLIDHHLSNTRFAGKNCIDTSAAACGEIIYSIAAEMGVCLNAAIAMPIYVAIATDTGCFSYSNTTSTSHLITARLFETGINHAAANKKLFNTKSRMRFDIERHILETMEYYDEGTIALCYLSRDLLNRLGASNNDTDEIANLPRQIEGVQVGITMKEGIDGTCKLSVRTSEDVDASSICALLGGGGHVRASGCTFDGDFNGAKDAILNAVRKVRAQSRESAVRE